MMIAMRVLRLRRPDADTTDIPVRIYAPIEEAGAWSCRIEIDWPEGARTMPVFGHDAVQALDLALKAVGVQLYTSDHHAAGQLMWMEPGKGYGFPVTNNIREMLVGDDRRLM